eukprot:2853675-Rhodomonas_salina.4
MAYAVLVAPSGMPVPDSAEGDDGDKYRLPRTAQLRPESSIADASIGHRIAMAAVPVPEMLAAYASSAPDFA